MIPTLGFWPSVAALLVLKHWQGFYFMMLNIFYSSSFGQQGTERRQNVKKPLFGWREKMGLGIALEADLTLKW